jgi:putative copper export protein/mono/diheme cytochrome c family protein
LAGLIVVHALNLACGALAFGIAALLALAVVPTVGRKRAADEPLARVLRHLIWLAWVAIAAELVSGVLWLLLQAASISGGSAAEAASAQVLAPVLMRTRFGHVLLLRFALALIFALCLALLPLARHPRMQVTVLSIAAAIAGSGLAAVAWAGHAVATPGILHLLADAIHLLAAGLWLGGLAVLVVLFGVAGRPADGAWLILLGATTRRFSLIGLACVGTLIVTGTVNGWFLVGTIPALVGTAYGQLLIVKLALFGLMVGLAAVNRFRLTPRLGEPGRNRPRAGVLVAIRLLRRNAAAEAMLGLLILGIVSALGAVPPGLHEQPWWPFSWRLSAEAMKAPSVRNEIVIALAMVVVGIVLFIGGILRRRLRLLAIPAGLALVACFVPSFGLLTVAAYPTSFAISPVAYTTQSIVRGSGLYSENCAACHGVRGRGNGPAASALKIPPANLTAAHVLDHREGDIFWWLTAGIPGSGMPGFADSLSEEERWDLVNWVRTLPIGGLDEGLVDEVVEGSAPRAPDFVFETADGAEGSLQDLLRSGPLLLVLFTPSSAGPRLQRLAAAEGTLVDAGLAILALPLADEGGSTMAPVPHFVARTDASVAATYRVIAAVPGYAPPRPARHLEFLIDGNGYVRALWLPEETIAWNDVGSLVNLVGQLAKRPLARGATPGHAHMQ